MPASVDSRTRHGSVRRSGDTPFTDPWSRFCRQVAASSNTNHEAALARATTVNEAHHRPYSNFSRDHTTVAPQSSCSQSHASTGGISGYSEGPSALDDEKFSCYDALNLSSGERERRPVPFGSGMVQTTNSESSPSSSSKTNMGLNSLSSSHPFSVYQLTKPVSPQTLKLDSHDPVVISPSASSSYSSQDTTTAVGFNVYAKALFKSPTRKRQTNAVTSPPEGPNTLLKCSHCSYSTQHRSAMTSHNRTHTGEKPYVCQFCPYRSSQSGNLMTHLKTHTGEKPFACDQCPYRSSQRIHLDRHMLTHLVKK